MKFDIIKFIGNLEIWEAMEDDGLWKNWSKISNINGVKLDRQ